MKSARRTPKSEARPPVHLEETQIGAPSNAGLPLRARLLSCRGAHSDSGFQIPEFAAGLLALAWLLLAGCAVGPDYQRPPALGTQAMPGAFAGTMATNLGEWKPAEPGAHLPRGTWWEIFGDDELNRLENLANTGNQELAAALAHFEQARAFVHVARADFFPQISTTPSLTRQHTSANSFQRGGGTDNGSTFNTFSVPLDASWELDLWGRVRRSTEAARARLAATADDLESARLAIQAEVAIDYFTLRSLDAQDSLLQQTITAYQRSLQLTQNRHKGGIATELDVAQAETLLNSTTAQVPVVDLQRVSLRHALATLCGQPATTFTLNESKKPLEASPSIPVSVPSEWLEKRPDIASAERRMAAANADVGVAKAAFYPRVMLNGLAGFQSIDAGTLFNWPSRVWAFGPSLQLPLFTGGRNRAQLAIARASYDETVANYRQTVLNAFQEVENQLAAQRLLAAEFEAENAALKSARRTLEISTTKYKGGVITYLEVVIAQSIALDHEQTVVRLAAERLASSVSLIKALGAGWSADSAQEASASPTEDKAAPARP